jgi:hypothetical protein
MKKLLLHRIREGEFNPSKSIQTTIDTLNTSYGRAKKTIKQMHSDDEVTFEESMTREFRYYSTEMQKIKIKQFEDEQKKMFILHKELVDIFEVDVWDEVIQNSEFDTLEELYEQYKLYSRDRV